MRRAVLVAALTAATIAGSAVATGAGSIAAQDRGEPVFPQTLRPRSVALVYEHLDGTPFKQPAAVHYDPVQDEVFVVDAGSGMIGIFDARGVPRFTFTPGSRFDPPIAVDTDGEGNIYVLMGGEQEIRVFDYRGTPVRTIPIEPVENIEPAIAGFRIGPGGRIYLLDNAGHRILVRGPDGSHVRIIRGSGRRGGRLQAPRDLAFDGEGNLYVSDSTGIPIQVYDPYGKYLRGWGEREIGPANFSTPSGISVDPEGFVFAADAVRQEIKVFDLQGNHLIGFGGFGSSAGDLAYPVDVAVGSGGRVFTVERVGRRLQVFTLTRGRVR